MKYSALLLSIKPKYAKKILLGDKTVELRRVRPPVAKGDKIVIYASSPVKAILAITTVVKVDIDKPNVLWGNIKDICGLPRVEFDEYFNGADIGYAIHIRDLQIFSIPIPLPVLKKIWSKFTPPQIYRYVSNQEYVDLMELKKSASSLDNMVSVSRNGLLPKL